MSEDEQLSETEEEEDEEEDDRVLCVCVSPLWADESVVLRQTELLQLHPESGSALTAWTSDLQLLHNLTNPPEKKSSSPQRCVQVTVRKNRF